MRTSRAWRAAILILVVALPLPGEAARSKGEDRVDGKPKGGSASRPECAGRARVKAGGADSLGDLAKHSKDPLVLTRQFQTAVQYFQQALRTLAERPPERTNEAAPSIYFGYVLVRSAHAGVDSRIKLAKFPDPGLKQKYKTIWVARRAVLQAHRFVDRPCPNAREVEQAVLHLNRGITIMQDVLRTGI